MEFSLLNERGVEVYNNCKAFLERVEIWDDIFAFQLEMYAFNIQESEKLAREINREGSTVKYTNKGGFTNEIVNPKLTAYQQLTAMAIKSASSFGLTPLARKKLNLKEKKQGNGFDLGFDDV